MTDSHLELQVRQLTASMKEMIRVLRDHTATLAGISSALQGVDAGIEAIRNTQRAQTRVTADIHELYANLRCVAPDPDDPPDGTCPDEDLHSRRSAEIRDLRLLHVQKRT